MPPKSLSFRRTPRRRFAGLVLALTVAGTGITLAGRAPAHALTNVGGVYLTSVDARIVADLNHARAAAGLPALRVSTSLTAAAASWSSSQAAANRIYHSPSWISRIERSGCPRWTTVSENVATAQVPTNYTSAQTGDLMLGLYRKSPQHWANIMSRSVTQVGVSSVDRMSTVAGTGALRSRLFNTIEFAAGCGASPQSPRTWGLFQERVVPAAGVARSVDRFESKDMRPAAANWSATMSSSLTWPTFTAGDDAIALKVANTSLRAGGAEGMALRQAVDLSRARFLHVRVRVGNAALRSVPITVYSRQQWGGASARNGADCLLGTVRTPTAATTVTLPVPAGCRYYANVFSFRVAASSLAALGTSLSSRAATFSIYGISVGG